MQSMAKAEEKWREISGSMVHAAAAAAAMAASIIGKNNIENGGSAGATGDTSRSNGEMAWRKRKKSAAK
jgi:hypothetical protein